MRTKLKSLGVIPTEKGFAIPSAPGDLVLFHFRLDHRATPANVNPVPKGLCERPHRCIRNDGSNELIIAQAQSLHAPSARVCITEEHKCRNAHETFQTH